MAFRPADRDTIYRLAREQLVNGARDMGLAEHAEKSAREVLQALVSFAPGSSFPRHKHPGEEIIYVITGTIEYEVAGKWVTVKPGDVLFVPDGVVHAARNTGKQPAAELATYVLKKGKPLTTFVK